MQNYGWAVAWRSLCWARLKNSANAYQELVYQLTPSVSGSNGTAINFFDIYDNGSSTGVFQIDANFGMPSAMVEMLLYSRPGYLQLLPALPTAWVASGSVTGLRARGGFTVNFSWTHGQVVTATVYNIGASSASTLLVNGNWKMQVTVAAGGSVTVEPAPTAALPTKFFLVNCNSGLAVEDPNSSASAGTLLDQHALSFAANQQWKLVQASGAASGVWNLINASSGLGMNVDGGATTPNQPIIQWPIEGATNEQWTVAPIAGGYVTVTNVRSGLVLGVATASTSTGAGIQQQTPNGLTSQQWLMTPTTFSLLNQNSGLVIEDPGSSTSAGTLLAQNTETGGANQHWTLVQASGAASGVWNLINASSGLCMNVDGGGTTSRSPTSGAAWCSVSRAPRRQPAPGSSSRPRTGRPHRSGSCPPDQPDRAPSRIRSEPHLEMRVRSAACWPCSTNHYLPPAPNQHPARGARDERTNRDSRDLSLHRVLMIHPGRWAWPALTPWLAAGGRFCGRPVRSSGWRRGQRTR